MATNNTSAAPVIWLITDNKPGHKNQLKGLGNRLRVLTGAAVYWVNAEDYSVPLWRAVLGLAPVMDTALPPPALIVAAGTGTHRLLLALRRYRKARTVILMKPAFPLARSEERRVGKECRSRWSRYHSKKEYVV